MARLLVVDDEPRFRTYLGRILEADGHEVRSAADDVAALEAAKDFAPDLLIADWMLRLKADGLTLAASLRRRHPGLAVVLITGHPADELRRHLAGRNIAAVLEKPFPSSEIRELVARVLGKGLKEA
jgi:two-component system response regulator (stage 0 sporulation protein F)